MNRIVILCVAVFGLLSTCAAQFHPCQFTQVSHAERSEGIAVSRVSLIEPSGEVGASVFIPDSNEPLPGIVFSHSAIQVLPRTPIWWVLRGRSPEREQLLSSLTAQSSGKRRTTSPCATHTYWRVLDSGYCSTPSWIGADEPLSEHRDREPGVEGKRRCVRRDYV